MAINPHDKWPTQTVAGDANQPYGYAKDVTVPGDGTGYPFEEDGINDILGFQQGLLVDAGITPSGLPDTAANSQYLTASNKLFLGNKTLAQAVAAKNVVEGARVVISDRGNGLFEYKTGQTPNGDTIIACTGVPSLSIVYQVSDANTVYSISGLATMQGALSGQAVYLSSGGRSGTFVWNSSDLSTEVAADPLEGIYVAPDGEDGSSGAWVRKPEGYVTPEMFGGVGNGVADDTAAIEAAFIHSAGSQKIRFSSGKTYVVSEIIEIDNNSDLTGVTKDYHVVAYGAKIFKKDFTGSAFLEVSHNPSGEWYQNRYLNDDWYFLWEGGEMDANGFNQNFREAANLRDGTGDIDTGRYPTQEQQNQALVYQALQAEVFGDPNLPWYINPLATNTPHTGQDGPWLRVSGATTFTVRDVITRNRHEEGFDGLCCQTINFENCHDYNGLPTNDQFQIYTTGGGDFVRGQQHFHMRSTNGQTLVRMVVSDTTNISVGDIVSGVSSEEGDEVTQGTVHEIDGNQLFLRQIIYGDGFEVGAKLVINGTESTATITSFNIIEAPTLNVSNCSSTTGNSGVGFMNVDYCPTYSVLSVVNYTTYDLGLIAVRSEHVHQLNISNSTFICANLLSDPTGTLDYWTQEGIEIGASTRHVALDNITLTNCCIAGSNFSRHDSQVLAGINIKVTEGVGRINAETLEVSKLDAIHTVYGNITGVTVESLPFTNYEGVYPIDTAIYAHKGRVSDFKINGCNTAIGQCERISSGEILNTEGTAIDGFWTEGGKQIATVSDVYANNIDSFMFCPGGSYATDNALNSMIRVSGCFVENVKGLVFNAPQQALVLELRDNTFRNWGLDTSLINDQACLVGSSSAGGAQCEELYLIGNTFRADAEDARKTLWYMNVVNTTIIERGSIYAKSTPDDWSSNKGGSEINVRDNYITSLVEITGDGLAMYDQQGQVKGACKFDPNRIAYSIPYGSAVNLMLYEDDNTTEFLTCNLGDTFTITAHLAEYAEGNQVMISGASSAVYISSSNTLGIYGDISCTIDGNPVLNNSNISAYLDGEAHTVVFTVQANATEIRYLGTAASGAAEQVQFPFYDIYYSSVVNDDRYYPFNDTSNIIVDKTSGHDAIINYEYDGTWYTLWV